MTNRIGDGFSEHQGELIERLTGNGRRWRKQVQRDRASPKPGRVFNKWPQHFDIDGFSVCCLRRIDELADTPLLDLQEFANGLQLTVQSLAIFRYGFEMRP